MSEDEVLVTFLSAVVGPVTWVTWLARLWRIRLRPGARLGRVAVTATLGACTAAIFLVLRTLASFDVVDAPVYLAMYSVLGLAWLRAIEIALPAFGLSVRDDVVERNNPAATVAVTGALVAATVCYAGGNIGDGPGWWVVVFSSGLATTAWLLLWLVFALFTPTTDSVTIDRDLAAGIRLGGFLVATALVLGRAVAGTWVSADATLAEVVAVLPAPLLILALSMIVEHRARPTAARPHPSVAAWGVLPASAFLMLAASTIVRMGPL